MYTLGCYLTNKESIHEEYKEFRLSKCTIKNVYKNVKEFVKNKQYISIMEIINEEFDKMVERYVSKYMVSFGNTDIETGTLYMGVSDNGEICGIPIKDELKINNYEKLKGKIMNNMTTVLNNELNLPNKNIILEKIKMDIIELKIDNDCIDDNLEEYLQHQKDKKLKYNEIEKKYKIEKQEYCDKLLKYKTAINDIINKQNIRGELIEHINNSSDGKLETKEKLIYELKKEQTIMFNQGQIIIEKEDDNKLAYWITNFRDHKINEILKTKPTRNITNRPMNAYYLLLRDFKPMMFKLISNNITFVIIKIIFPGKRQINVPLYHYETGVPTRLYRTLNKTKDPCTHVYKNEI